MKATELRIGNLVFLIDRTQEVHLPNYVAFKVLVIEPFKVHCILANEHPASTEWIEVDINDISSIPLTEEWLLKFGFQYHEEGTYFYRPEDHNLTDAFISVLFEDGSIFVHVVQFDGVNQNHIIELSEEMKYVHRLQNLCYSLTGEELKILTPV